MIKLIFLFIYTAQGIWLPQMENSNLFEGDVLFDPNEMQLLKHQLNSYASIKGGRWPNGVVPYEIDSDLAKSYMARRSIEQAISHYEKHTCLKFPKRTTEKEYIYFSSKDGCFSPIGYRKNRVNLVSLGKGCHTSAIAIHEIGHSIGLDHEQNRVDREKYVEIKWSNIIPDQKSQFLRRSASNTDSLNTTYDYLSVMHYGRYAFARSSRLVTIDTKNKYRFVIGKAKELSNTDKIQVNKMYNCQ